jgi:hypothetical protein
MPTFIDERGDTGTRPDSDSHFQLAAVWLPNQEVVETFRTRMRTLREEQKLPQDYEFKFAKTWTQLARREAFFRFALDFPFRFAFASLDKRSAGCTDRTHAQIHQAVVTELAATLRPLYLSHLRQTGLRRLGEPVTVDDNQDGSFLKIIKETFRGIGKGETPPADLIGKVRFRGSGAEDLLQLADMVVGACGANVEGNPDWYRLILDRDVGRVIPV